MNLETGDTVDDAKFNNFKRNLQAIFAQKEAALQKDEGAY